VDDLEGVPGFEDGLLRRFHLAQKNKSINNGILLDKDEEYEQKQVTFGGLNEMLLTAYQVAAGACDIPVTRLLGRSASGLNSSGDTEVRDYYDTLRAKQHNDIGPAMRLLDAHVARQAGAPDAVYEWNSLWQTTDKENAETLNTTATAIKTLADTALFGDDELTEAARTALANIFPPMEGDE